MKRLLIALLVIVAQPIATQAQEYVATFNTQHQYDTQYKEAKMKYAFENYKGSHKSWHKKFYNELADILGITELKERYKDFVPKAELLSTEDIGFATRERWQIWTEPTMIIPMVITRPKNCSGKMPICITPQGHNTNPEIYSGVITNEKDSIAIATKDTDVALRAAKLGFIAINPTTRGFGKTRHPDAIRKNRPHSCQYYMQRGVLTGRNLIGDRVWDVMKIIDWALTNLPVDTSRIVVTGNSGGGTVTLYAGAMDSRITLCAPSSCFCSFEASIGTIHHCPCNHIPYIMDLCNMGDIAGLIAPRKLLIINGNKDEIFPIGPAREEFKTTKAVYEAFGVAENCEMYEGDGPHRYFWAGFSDYYKRHF